MTSLWVNRILAEFPSDLARLWIVSDPDDVLLEEQVLSELRARGFDVLPFEDGIVFRAEYEERYRAAWDRGVPAAFPALILHLRETPVSALPWDYLQQAKTVSLSLSRLLPRLSYPVVRLLDAEMRPALFEAQTRYARQDLGETATKEFALTHLFEISPHLIRSKEALWREILRLHFRETALPSPLADYIAEVICANEAFRGLPIADCFRDRAITLRTVQQAWYHHLAQLGILGARTAEPAPPDYGPEIAIPFAHRDVRSILDSMFLEGMLHPVVVQRVPAGLPEWTKLGLVEDPATMRNLVANGIKSLAERIPGIESPHRDWTQFSRRLGEVISRFDGLDTSTAEEVRGTLLELQCAADQRLREWVSVHYPDLPSLPAAKGPVMLHHVPRYLAMRRGSGEQKIALLVFDGLAVDQWVQIREHVIKRAPGLLFDESACFAWTPTLTSISRQALFSGLRPREFAESVDITDRESTRWLDFWENNGLRRCEVLYHRSLQTAESLPGLKTELDDPAIKVVGLVVDTVDKLAHGAVLGKRGIATQIASWCDSNFVDRLLLMLLDRDFHVYLTADHGNVEAIGIGKPNQGVAPETCGERVRIYRSEALRTQASMSDGATFAMDLPGLPSDCLPLYAGGRGAFVRKGDRLVAHGGISVEELIVPFIKVHHTGSASGTILPDVPLGTQDRL